MERQQTVNTEPPASEQRCKETERKEKKRDKLQEREDTVFNQKNKQK